jgi:hypothetical protein
MGFAEAADTLFRLAGDEIDYLNGMITSRSSKEPVSGVVDSEVIELACHAGQDNRLLHDKLRSRRRSKPQVA